MATLFIDGYNKSMFVHHKDGDINNCSLDNLYVNDGLTVLKDFYHETKRWKPVVIKKIKLYYDYYICEDGRLYNATTDAFVKPFKNYSGKNVEYLRFNLYYGKTIHETIHFSVSRLVALTFLQKPKDKDCIIFIDDNHSNVSVENLQWVDRWDVMCHNLSSECREFNSLYYESLGEEKWKNLKYFDYEFFYEYKISNFGRVYNVTKGFYPTIYNQSMKNANNQFHKSVSICFSNGKYDTIPLHRLVAYNFCKNKDYNKYTCVNHINGNPECNLSINLEWCTPYENMHHAMETNLYHTDKFDKRVDDKYWRVNTILAWIYSMDEISDYDAYCMYCTYNEVYNDNLPEYSFDEFKNEYKERKENNDDFKKLELFYTCNY
jgi:hypothetical protein